MKAIDVFCGAGGTTVGLKAAGFKVVGALDLDEVAVETYCLNHPKVKVWKEDVSSFQIETVQADLNIDVGELDLLAGCPPCQGFSTLTTRNGSIRVTDPRNELLFEFLRLVTGLRPKHIMMENVPGLYKDRRLRQMLSSLSKVGYKFTEESYGIRNAMHYGVPQSRRRMILLASRSKNVALAPGSDDLLTVRDAIGHLPKPSRSDDELHRIYQQLSEPVLKRVRSIPKNGGSRSTLPVELTLACHRNTSSDGYKDVYGRMAWDKPAPTITSGCINPSKGRFLHPEQNRGITLREAALLQSFPPNYKFSLSRGRSRVALMIGNALPSSFIAAQSINLL